MKNYHYAVNNRHLINSMQGYIMEAVQDSDIIRRWVIHPHILIVEEDRKIHGLPRNFAIKRQLVKTRMNCKTVMP